jgi:hypothetical protein
MRLPFASPLAALLLMSPFDLGGSSAAHAEEPHEVRVGTLEVEEPTVLGPEAELPRTGKAPAWVVREPGPETQTQKSVQERGANPCMAPDPGFGDYDGWDRSPSVGQMIVPTHLALGPDDTFDVFFHFHGHEPARKAWVQAMHRAVFVGVDLGNGSGSYTSRFQIKDEFERLLASVEQAVAERSGVPGAHAGRIGLSSWSAGYGAVGQVLRDTDMAERVDTVVLLDGLHTGLDGDTLEVAKLRPFADFAEAAARGDKLMFVSHSSIIPPGYASTTQTANYLIWQVGGTPQETHSRAGDPVGLDLISRYNRGGFHVRGFSGNDTLDHCAQLSLYKDVLRTHVAPRWEP